MNTALRILAAMLMCAGMGCEGKRAESEAPVEHDPRIDGPPCIFVPADDETILADQTQLAAADQPAGTAAAPTAETPEPPIVETPAPAPAPEPRRVPGPEPRRVPGRPVRRLPAPPPRPTSADADVEAVRQLISKAAEAAKAGNGKPLVNLFSGPFATTVGKVFAMKTKADSLSRVLKEKLGRPPSGELQREFSHAAVKAKMVLISSAGQLKFAKARQNVTVTDRSGDVTVFSKTPQGWKGSVDPRKVKAAGMEEDVVDRMARFFDEVTAAINDGRITADNLDEQVVRYLAKHTLTRVRREAEPPRREAGP